MATPGTTLQNLIRTYPTFLTSPSFKLTVGPSSKEFYVHKDLLATLSPELYKHTHNDMKEGQENTMALTDVLEETMERFLEWAYTGDYPEQTPHETSTTGNTPDDAASTASGSTTTTTAKDKKGGKEKSALKSAPSSHLIIHARLYALADRFNVTGLKGLAFTKLTDILVELDYLTDPRDIKDAIAMIAYAFENLPVASGESGGMGEKLLDYLVQYAAWSLGALRVHEEFWELVEGEADFAKGVLAGVEEAEIAPWKEQGKAKEKRKIKKSNAPKKEDVLKRRCTNGNCGWVGNFLVRCPSCNFLDHKTNQCGEYLEGVQTLTGTGSSLLYKCWRSGCGWSHAFNGMPTLNCASCYGTGYNYNV